MGAVARVASVTVVSRLQPLESLAAHSISAAHRSHTLAQVAPRVRNSAFPSLANPPHLAYNPQYTPLNPRFSPTAFIRRHDALHVSLLRLAADERYSLGRIET